MVLHSTPEMKEANATMSQRIFTEVRRMIAEHKEIDPDAVLPTSLLAEDLGLDSLDALEVMLDVEVLFDIAMPEEFLYRMKSVQDVCSVIAEQLAERSGRSEPGQG